MRQDRRISECSQVFLKVKVGNEKGPSKDGPENF